MINEPNLAAKEQVFQFISISVPEVDTLKNPPTVVTTHRNPKSYSSDSVRYWDCFVRFRTPALSFQQLGGIVFFKKMCHAGRDMALQVGEKPEASGIFTRV